MSKTLLYKLFRAGEIPKKLKPIMEREGILFMEEGISSVIHFRKFRAPGRYYGHKVSWGSGSIVLTKEHLLAFRFSSSTIGLAWNSRQARLLKFSIDDCRLCIAYDASLFNDKWSGDVEVKYACDNSKLVLTIIQQQLKLTRVND